MTKVAYGSARSSPPETRAFVGGDAHGPSIAIPFRLQRALLAAGISDGANVTLQVVYQYAAISLANGHVNDAGEVRVWPSQDTLALHRGLSSRTVAAHLKELETVGAIRRVALQKREKLSELWVRAIPHVLDLLMQDADLRARLEQQFPDTTQGKVVSLPEYMSTRECTDDEAIASIHQGKVNTSRKFGLQKTLATATEQSAPIHEREAAKREARAAVRPAKPARERSIDNPESLLTMLKHCVKDDLNSIVQPKDTAENKAKMGMLASNFGYPNTRRLIEFATTPDNWERLRAKYRLDTPFPTPGILLGFSETWMPMALGTTPIDRALTAKRSGGAAPVDLAAFGVAEDPNSF